MAVNISFDPSWGLGLMADAQARRYEYNYRDKTDAEERGLRRELAGMDDRFRRDELTARERAAAADQALRGRELDITGQHYERADAALQTTADADMKRADAAAAESVQRIARDRKLLEWDGLDRDAAHTLAQQAEFQRGIQTWAENQLASGVPKEAVEAGAHEAYATNIRTMWQSPEMASFFKRQGYTDAEHMVSQMRLASGFLAQLSSGLDARAAVFSKQRQSPDAVGTADAQREVAGIDRMIADSVRGVLEVGGHLQNPETRAAIEQRFPGGVSIFKNPEALPSTGAAPGKSPYLAGTDTKAVTGTPQTAEGLRIQGDKDLQNSGLYAVMKRDGMIPAGAEPMDVVDHLSRGYGLTGDSFAARKGATQQALAARTPEGRLKAVNDARELSAARAGGSYEDAVRRRAPINAVFKQISPEGTRVNGFEDRWGESIFRNGQTPDEWNQNFVSDVEQTERENRAEMQALAAEFGITDPNSPEYWDLAARATWESRKGDIKNSWLGGWLSNPMPGQENVSTLGKLNAELVRNRWRQGLRGVSTVNSRKPWQ